MFLLYRVLPIVSIVFGILMIAYLMIKILGASLVQ